MNTMKEGEGEEEEQLRPQRKEKKASDDSESAAEGRETRRGGEGHWKRKRGEKCSGGRRSANGGTCSIVVKSRENKHSG